MLALRRADVWPAADLALRRAVERVWGLDPPTSVEQVDTLGERFRPWANARGGASLLERLVASAG
jgi:3-methyladenine DNA glycosylase/8-oxoguanine DNA glycosylase